MADGLNDREQQHRSPGHEAGEQREFLVIKRMGVAVIDAGVSDQPVEVFAQQLFVDEGRTANDDSREVPSAADDADDERAAQQMQALEDLPAPGQGDPNEGDER